MDGRSPASPSSRLKEAIARKRAALEGIKNRRLARSQVNDVDIPSRTHSLEIPSSEVLGHSSNDGSDSLSLAGGAVFDDGRAEEQKNDDMNHQQSCDPPLNEANKLQKKMAKLAQVEVNRTDIPPHETITYSKVTQTSEPGMEELYTLKFDYDSGQSEDESFMDHRLPKLPPGILPHGMPEVTDVAPALTAAEQVAIEVTEPYKPHDLSKDEKQMIIMSSGFQNFMDRAAKIMEDALNERNVDFCFDYGLTTTYEEKVEERSQTKIKLNRVFYDEKWSKNRCVTSMHWAEERPECLLSSYGSNSVAVREPEGVCLTWNSKSISNTPECVFHCQSAVTSACFANFHPNLVLGGTYCGSIVLWDTRANKPTPVQRTPLTTTAHTHPVYCLKSSGTQNIISISSDGKLCSWSLDRLSEPLESVMLINSNLIIPREVAPTCISFPQGYADNILIGCEDGNVYDACWHGLETGVMKIFEGHHAPVTGLSPHKVPGPIDFSHLYLTSSFDWSVKLWSLKESRPIYSFECGDYIHDVSWSPINPSVFATVDGGGKLDLWNLNNDTEVPTASATVENPVPVALNQLSWDQSGHVVAAGDDLGKIWVYGIDEYFVDPGQDDWAKFDEIINELNEKREVNRNTE